MWPWRKGIKSKHVTVSTHMSNTYSADDVSLERKVCFPEIIESYEVQTVILKVSSNYITKTCMKGLCQLNKSNLIREY